MRGLTAMASLIVSLVLFGSGASAEVTICNEAAATIHVALANQDNDGYRATGWWAVRKGDCQNTDFTLQGDTLYYTADSDGYRDGRYTKHDHWGNKLKLFVGRNKFDFTDAEKNRRGAKTAMFSSASSSSSRVEAVTIHFKPSGTSIEFKDK